MEPTRIIEALIFVADHPLKPVEILDLWQQETFEEIPLDPDQLIQSLQELQAKYQSETYAFELRQIDGGYQFFSKPAYFPYVRQAALLKNQKRLGRSAMETLSIIAYRQPVTKAEIEFIRGVGSDYAIQKLLEKKLIDIQGRSDAPGRPLIYGTSSFFMEYFGLNNLSDLPKLQEFNVDESTYQAQFKNYLEEKEQTEAPES